MKLWALIAVVLAVGSCLAEETPLDQGYRHMYNLQFEAAHKTFNDWERTHPEDPMGPVSDAAAFLFAEFDRLHILESEFFTDDANFTRPAAKLSPDPNAKRRFDDAIGRTRWLAGRALAANPGDVNAQFADIMRMGLRADYLALIEKSNLAALSEMKTGREKAERLLAAHPEMKDAYLAVGVENYMLSLKPAPVRWVLRMAGAQTDKDQGIRQLTLTAEKGRYLRPFARLLLAVAALRDHNKDRARVLLAGLVQEFPRNQLYAQELGRLR